MAFGLFGKKNTAADRIFRGGTLLTQDPNLPKAEAVAVKDWSTASSSETAISELCRHYKTSTPRSWSSRNPRRGTLHWRWSCSRRAARCV